MNTLEKAAREYAGIKPDVFIDSEERYYNGHACENYDAFKAGAEWMQNIMIDKACKCYCDDICDKGRCGMCFHKHDDKGQVKNTFRYNECNELKLMCKAMEE